MYELGPKFSDVGTNFRANAITIFLKALHLWIPKMHDSSVGVAAFAKWPPKWPPLPKIMESDIY